MPTKKSVIIAMLLMAASGVALAAGPEEAIQAVAQLANAVSVADLIIKAGHNEDGTPKIHKVPTLKVVRDCAHCKFGNALRMLVVAAYKQEAEKNGLEVDPDASVVLRVTSTFERPTFLRGTFGVLAGADFIAGNLGTGRFANSASAMKWESTGWLVWSENAPSSTWCRMLRRRNNLSAKQGKKTSTLPKPACQHRVQRLPAQRSHVRQTLLSGSAGAADGCFLRRYSLLTLTRARNPAAG